MDDANGKLEHRTEQAFARMDKRVKKIEHVAISRQQLEDLIQLAPKIEDVLRRVTRIENAMIHWQDQREALHKNAYMIAEECCFIRERLLTVEGRIPRAHHPAKEEAEK